jgi:hypothetical protein
MTSHAAAALIARLRTFTWSQVVVLTAGVFLLAIGLAGLGAGRSDQALAASFLLQMMLVALVLLAVRRISRRINTSTGRVLQAMGDGGRFATQMASTDAERAAGCAVIGGALPFYARSNRKKQSDLVRQLVLDRSLDGRDILACGASGGTLDFRGLSAHLEAFRSPAKRAEARRLARQFDREALLSLARVIYRQDFLPEDPLNAVTLYELVYSAFGRGALSNSDAEWMVNALLQERRTDDATRWLETLRMSPERSPNYAWIRANAHNPYVQPSASDEQEWLRWLNAGFLRAGLERVELEAGTGAPFSRLTAAVRNRIDTGPLVSVIMPVYRAGPSVDVAVRSILAQSWKRVELIIVDDGSPAEYIPRLESWTKADTRVRLIRCANNRGAYIARNIGLGAAQGEFVTCHDSDDWSHPAKLERQATDLLARPERIANVTTWLRVTEALEIRHRRPSQTLAHVALVSLMFRRKPVMARVGHWDAVRKMGDAEFMYRLELVFGQKIEPVGSEPMSLALQAADSLSGADMHRGFMDPERQIYLERYRTWHQRIALKQASAWLAAEPGTRPFPAPASFLPSRGGELHFDVIFVSELGFKGGSGHSLLHEMTICVDAGLKVGLVHVRNLLFPAVARKKPISELTELITVGAVTELALTTRASAALVIVRWPACFQFTSSVTPRIRAERTVIVANHPPYERHQDRYSYEIGTVTRNVRKAFDAEPRWAPQSATIRAMLEPQLPHGALLDIDWVAVLAGEPKATGERRLPVSSGPVIGRHSRDHHLKWPGNRKTLLQIYPPDGPVKVKVLGGVDRVVRAGALKPGDIAEWEVYPFDAIHPMQFLRSIDFFVYFHHAEWVESFGRVIMEAMFAGAVAVLPRSFETVFGDAAVYAQPEEVRTLVADYYRDWSLFQAQSARGLAYVNKNCTAAAYRRRLARLGVEIASGSLALGVAQ